MARPSTRMKAGLFLLLSMVLLARCSPEDAGCSVSEDDRGLWDAVKRAREEAGLNNAEMEAAVLRGAKVLTIFDEAIRAGVITEAEVENLPVMLRHWEENQLESDSYAAALALSVLRALDEGEAGEMKMSLRKIVSVHYQELGGKPGDPYPAFRKRVEEYAARDALLRKRLEGN